ncbi:MAG TPA: hydantoinase/oxoprolinase family protein [Candidatus Baltobacteraceae bacterium]|jgi:N-methylhydantoinase A/oxoprolinase/acetone carboxylase beta subunit|nr:hydantoinase/oxoprolinase family protein [Candidatus Baltobacteraceae bacterium]
MTMLRIGIDVGGTFTDVVAIDAATREIVVSLKIPTTHRHPEGVAAGIVDGLQRLLADPRISAESVTFIAHSTTQATNALLEGDVASVGLVGVDARNPFVRRHLRMPPIRLTETVGLRPRTVFVSSVDRAGIALALERLVAQGVEVVAASAAFGVDDSHGEELVVECARACGLSATSGHDVASSYGLRARTRTAVLNAAILPTMMRTARMTTEAVARAGIRLPLMIMRSDGGVMDVREVERRPILTMLSGPAAGIAGALLHENVSDGIFIEVGGTSADCSAIVRGRPVMRAARIGGHRTMLRTLDVRTVGVAGGSLVSLDASARAALLVRDVGPRSAHIAGLAYACFQEYSELVAATLVRDYDHEHLHDDMLVLRLPSGKYAALTPTCAANALGLVPEGAFARSDAASARRAFESAARDSETPWEELANSVLERACAKVRTTVSELIADYALDVSALEFVGGGGGAAALVPFLARMMGVRWRLARDAEVISPVGVALALVREVVERTIANPSPDEVVSVRREAIERVVAAGAARELVEASVEVDTQRSVVRATAQGATSMVNVDAQPAKFLSAEERREALERVVGATSPPVLLATVGAFMLFEFQRATGKRQVFAHAFRSIFAVVDARAVVRLVARRAVWRIVQAGRVMESLPSLLDEQSSFGDAGRALPEIALVYGTRCVELGTPAETSHILALAQEEIGGVLAQDPILIVAMHSSRSASDFGAG